MTHTYNISGMTCTGCQAKVHQLLSNIPGVTNVDINLLRGKADITMSSHIATATLQDALKEHPKYQLTEEAPHHAAPVPAFGEEKRSWLQTYKPLLIIFGYITLITVLAAFNADGFDWMRGMSVFMAGFFLTFSFFKMLDLQGFADSYAMYDVVAKKFRGWALIYPFVELLLGIAYAADFKPLITNGVTFVVMAISIVGVLQSVLNKRRIQCACLGAVFNLPMSTVTIIEDALMIAMSGISVATMTNIL